MAEKTVQPYYNIPFLPLENESQDSRHGAQFFRNVKQLQVGFGSSVFRVDRDGMWAGAEDFASAPWSVDWDGNMVANSITLSGYIPTGGALTDIGAGNITNTYIGSNAIAAANIQAGAVTATKISVSSLSAISANIGTITAGSITGITITGGTIRTATSGSRIVLDGSSNDINIYDSSSVRRARGYQQGWEFYNDSGTLVGELYASNSLGLLLAGDLTSTGDIYYGVGSSGAHSFHVGTVGSTLRMFVDTNDIWIGDVDNLALDIQFFGYPVFNYERGFRTPTVGRVSSGGVLSGGGASWSASRDSTGVYTVTHSMGSSSYSVVATVESSTGDLKCKIGSRGSSSFTVRVDSAGILTDAAFDFILIYY